MFDGRQTAVAKGVRKKMGHPAFPFEAVIFDMDGVLVDTEAAYQDELVDFVRAFDLPVSASERLSVVGGSHQSFRLVVADWLSRGTHRFGSVDEAFDCYAAWAETRSYDYRALLFPDVVPAISRLQERGVRLALASSSPMDNIREVLDACGLAHVFETVVSGEQFKESKPEPDIYLHVLSDLRLPAERCCCVEDSVPGITAGKRAGLTVLARREERFGFSQDHADRIIDSLGDLLSL